MATSQAEAQLIERKLRPLYGKSPAYKTFQPWFQYFVLHCADAVDNGQNKKAIQLADKLLRKQEDLYPAKVSLIFTVNVFRVTIIVHMYVGVYVIRC